MEQAALAIEAREERPATDEEIAAHLEMPLEKYFKMLSDIHGAALLSLDSYIRNDENDNASSKPRFRTGCEAVTIPLKV